MPRKEKERPQTTKQKHVAGSIKPNSWCSSNKNNNKKRKEHKNLTIKVEITRRTQTRILAKHNVCKKSKKGFYAVPIIIPTVTSVSRPNTIFIVAAVMAQSFVIFPNSGCLGGRDRDTVLEEETEMLFWRQ